MHADHQRLLGKLINDFERLKRSSIMGAILDEVVGPDMVRPLRSEPDT